MPIRLKRIYQDPEQDDGHRVLVDRLWPRGVSKDAARLDDWAKEAAPSADLRRWYDHDPDKWDEFRERYRRELHASDEAGQSLRRLAGILKEGRRITLLSATKDTEHTHSHVLRDVISGLAAH